MRLQVFLSRNGVCSRRKALDIIKQGDVKVNSNIILEPSFDVDSADDKIEYNNRIIHPKEYTYILLNKSAGYVTTRSDIFAKRTIYDLLPKKYHHLSPVGRLDKDTEGLLILTNDGDFAYRISHPSFNIDKTYFVIAKGKLGNNIVKKLESGLVLEGRKTATSKIEKIIFKENSTNFYLTIHEGRKRQIRKMLELVGSKVIYLKRTAQGRYKLGNLKKGMFKHIKP